MKNTIINIVLLLSSLAFSAYASGQSSVWATAESIETVTQNEEFQYLQAHLGIEVTQPLTNSRQPHLQKVYEFSCQCDEVELYASMHKVSDVSGIEYGPKYETLNEPDDFLKNKRSLLLMNLIDNNENIKLISRQKTLEFVQDYPWESMSLLLDQINNKYHDMFMFKFSDSCGETIKQNMKKFKTKKKILICGFGVGLSASIILFNR